MAVKPILRMGDPRLLEVATEVEAVPSTELDALIQDLFDTMAANNGAGLAAPQISVGLRVVVFGIQANPRYPDAEEVPTTVLINPVITVLDETGAQGWEGCLSVPGLRGLVARPARIAYRGLAADGSLIEREASGFHARVMLHEFDHLDGILYPMRMSDLSQFGFEAELEADGRLGC